MLPETWGREKAGMSSGFSFSATREMAKQSKTFYKRLAYRLAEKGKHPYSSTLSWLRCLLSLSLLRRLRSAIQSIRSAHSSCGHTSRFPPPNWPGQRRSTPIIRTLTLSLCFYCLFLLTPQLTLKKKKCVQKSVCVWHIMPVRFQIPQFSGYVTDTTKLVSRSQTLAGSGYARRLPSWLDRVVWSSSVRPSRTCNLKGFQNVA